MKKIYITLICSIIISSGYLVVDRTHMLSADTVFDSLYSITAGIVAGVMTSTAVSMALGDFSDATDKSGKGAGAASRYTQLGFIKVNYSDLENESAIGRGANLDNLATLMGCTNKDSFASAIRQKHGLIFKESDDPAEWSLASIEKEILGNPELARTCAMPATTALKTKEKEKKEAAAQIAEEPESKKQGSKKKSKKVRKKAKNVVSFAYGAHYIDKSAELMEEGASFESRRVSSYAHVLSLSFGRMYGYPRKNKPVFKWDASLVHIPFFGTQYNLLEAAAYMQTRYWFAGLGLQQILWSNINYTNRKKQSVRSPQLSTNTPSLIFGLTKSINKQLSLELKSVYSIIARVDKAKVNPDIITFGEQREDNGFLGQARLVFGINYLF